MTGDGSFGMSVGELETISRLGLPIVIIQCSNGTFGWIKELQHLYHDDRYFGVDFNPVDYAAIARGFGFRAAQVTDPEDVEPFGSGGYSLMAGHTFSTSLPSLRSRKHRQWRPGLPPSPSVPFRLERGGERAGACGTRRRHRN